MNIKKIRNARLTAKRVFENMPDIDSHAKEISKGLGVPLHKVKEFLHKNPDVKKLAVNVPMFELAEKRLQEKIDAGHWSAIKFYLETFGKDVYSTAEAIALQNSLPVNLRIVDAVDYDKPKPKE